MTYKHGCEENWSAFDWYPELFIAFHRPIAISYGLDHKSKKV